MRSSLEWPKCKFFWAYHQASEVTVPSTIFACVAGQNVSLPQNLPWNLVLLRHFLILLTLNPHNFGQSGQNADFFLPITKPLRWRIKEKVFTILTLFAHVAGHTTWLPSTKLPFWAFVTAYLGPGRSKWDTVKSNKPYDKFLEAAQFTERTSINCQKLS